LGKYSSIYSKWRDWRYEIVVIHKLVANSTDNLMNIDRRKIKDNYVYFILGLLCVSYALWQLFLIGKNNASNEFVKINGHVARPLEFKKQLKGSSEWVEIRLKEYPLFTFQTSDREIINKKQLLLDSIYYGNHLELGEIVSCVVEQNDANYINLGNIDKYNIGELNLNDHIKIYSLEDKYNSYLSFNIEDYNNDLNSGRLKSFIVFSLIGLVCFIYGRHKTRKTVSH
jgi:hypothetical protein